MKILVAVKRVPATNAYLPLSEDGQLDLCGVRHIVNPRDEIALDLAVRLREQGQAEEIIAVSVAPEDEAGAWEETLRAALARGADRAVLVQVKMGEGGRDDGYQESIALHLAHAAKSLGTDLVLMGQQGTDSDDGLMGARVAGILGYSLVPAAQEVAINSGAVQAVTEIERGTTVVRSGLPAVVTSSLNAGTPRLLSLYAIRQAMHKPLAQQRAEPVPHSSGARRVGYRVPPSRTSCRMVFSIEELLDGLGERGIDLAAEKTKPQSPEAARFADSGENRYVGTEDEANALAWLAGSRGWPIIRGVTEAWLEKGAYHYRRSAYSGRLQEIVAVSTSQEHILIVPNPQWRTEQQRARVAELLSHNPMPQVTVLSEEAARVGKVDLATARVVVAGGRGLRDRESFGQLAGGLAEALGGAVAASGGASNVEIAPASLVIGQSGRSVAPELYVALGISGADQHVAGFRNAKTVVAINTDPEAPIFRYADIGLVADLREAIPEWMEKVRR